MYYGYSISLLPSSLEAMSTQVCQQGEVHTGSCPLPKEIPGEIHLDYALMLSRLPEVMLKSYSEESAIRKVVYE